MGLNSTKFVFQLGICITSLLSFKNSESIYLTFVCKHGSSNEGDSLLSSFLQVHKNCVQIDCKLMKSL